jgi:hypothetical protein
MAPLRAGGRGPGVVPWLRHLDGGGARILFFIRLSHCVFMIANRIVGVSQLFFDLIYGDMSGRVARLVLGGAQKVMKIISGLRD